MTTLVFKDGTELKGKIIAEALVIIIFRVDSFHFLVNKLALADDGVSRNSSK